MAVTAAKQDIMDTDWHFGTPVYRIEKPEWCHLARLSTDKYIKQSEKNVKTLKERKSF